MVESADEILEEADHKNVAFLVIGDPFGATTHTDLVLRAKEKNIKVEVEGNVTIVSAVSCCGLKLYRYGEVVSIPFWTETWQPDSFFDKIVENYKRGSHTLCLLDIKVKEPTLESILKKKKVYMPPKFMSVAEAADQLLQIIERKSKNNTDILRKLKVILYLLLNFISLLYRIIFYSSHSIQSCSWICKSWFRRSASISLFPF